MASKRMFAKTIIDSDAFLDMPVTSQLLYFHLAMRADDDGFINKPKSITRMVGASQGDIEMLITKKFIIPFESGIVVIKHWKIHNYIAKDRYTETTYKEEKDMLGLDENNAYTECIQIDDSSYTERIQDVYSLETQVRIDKDSIDKNRIDIYSVDKSNCNITCKTNSKTNSKANVRPLEEDKNKNKNKNKEYIVQIVNYLNEKAGTNYKATTKDTVSHINARLSDGFTVDDFKTVIDKKVNEWQGTEFEKYLRPKTLFGTKFESYLNAKMTGKTCTVVRDAQLDEIF